MNCVVFLLLTFACLYDCLDTSVTCDYDVTGSGESRCAKCDESGCKIASFWIMALNKLFSKTHILPVTYVDVTKIDCMGKAHEEKSNTTSYANIPYLTDFNRLIFDLTESENQNYIVDVNGKRYMVISPKSSSAITVRNFSDTHRLVMTEYGLFVCKLIERSGLPEYHVQIKIDKYLKSDMMNPRQDFDISFVCMMIKSMLENGQVSLTNGSYSVNMFPYIAKENRLTSYNIHTSKCQNSRLCNLPLISWKKLINRIRNHGLCGGNIRCADSYQLNSSSNVVVADSGYNHTAVVVYNSMSYHCANSFSSMYNSDNQIYFDCHVNSSFSEIGTIRVYIMTDKMYHPIYHFSHAVVLNGDIYFLDPTWTKIDLYVEIPRTNLQRQFNYYKRNDECNLYAGKKYSIYPCTNVSELDKILQKELTKGRIVFSSDKFPIETRSMRSILDSSGRVTRSEQTFVYVSRTNDTSKCTDIQLEENSLRKSFKATMYDEKVYGEIITCVHGYQPYILHGQIANECGYDLHVRVSNSTFTTKVTWACVRV